MSAGRGLRTAGTETGVPVIFLHHLPDRRMAI
jgi:hypothetical protein